MFGDTSMTDKALNSFHASSFYCNLIKAMSNEGKQGDEQKNMDIIKEVSTVSEFISTVNDVYEQ